MHAHPVNPLETDDVAVEEIALEFLGEVAAREDPGAGTGARRPVPELIHRGVFLGVVDMPAERRCEIAIVARGVGDDVVPPVVEDAPVRIGEIVGCVRFEAPGIRLEAVDRGIDVADHARGAFRPACDEKRHH